MMHLMIASMIAANVYKVNEVETTPYNREKGYIPAPVEHAPGPGAEGGAAYEHMPYSPVIMCTALDEALQKGIAKVNCEHHTRTWLKF